MCFATLGIVLGDDLMTILMPLRHGLLVLERSRRAKERSRATDGNGKAGVEGGDACT
jgi:hypothetical protein